MTDLSTEQAALRASIHKSGLIWGAIAGLVAGGLSYWLAGGLDSLPRIGITVVVAAVAGYASYRGIMSSGAKQARCAACNTPFSVKESGRSEELLRSEAKSKVEEAPVAAAATDKTSAKLAAKAANPGKVLTKWTEETYAVTVTSTCAKCQDVTTRTHNVVREKDKQTITK